MIWLLVALCWIISFLFAGIEAGLLALDPVRLWHRAKSGDRGVRRLQEMLKEPDRLLVTVLLVTNAADITALVILTRELVSRLGWLGYPIEVLQTSEKSGIDRFPIFADNAEPLGLINVYDILFDTESSRPLRHYMRRIITASENESAYRVVRRLRAARIGLAAVVDSRQKSTGIVALEDLVRQLVQG